MTDQTMNAVLWGLVVLIVLMTLTLLVRDTNAQHVTPEPGEQTMSILFEPHVGDATEFLNTVANDAIRSGNFQRRDEESVVARQGNTAIIFQRFSERIVLVALVDLAEDQFYSYGTPEFDMLRTRVSDWGRALAYAHPPGENV